MRYLILLLILFRFSGQAQTCTVTISNSTPTICSGASVTLTASGATTYTWNTGSTSASIVVTPTVTTSYTVTGVAGTCTQVVTTTVTVNALPSIAIAPTTPTVCYGNAIVLTASGGSTYTWSTGPTTTTISVSPTVTTSYSVTGTGSNGCKLTVSKTVTVNPNLTLSNPSPTICTGSAVILTAAGATTYSWNTGATTSTISVSPTVTTAYTVTGVKGSCSRLLTTTITVNSFTALAISPTSPTLCFGSSIVLTASGASSYTWNTGPTTTTISVSPTVTTTYSVTGTGSNGCKQTSSKSVTVTNLAVTLSNPTPSICIGSPAILTAGGATSYSWNTGATTASISVSPTITANYTVTGTTGSCSKSLTTTVYPAAIPNVSITATSMSVCVGNSSTLTASGASTYSWSTGVTTTSIIVTPTATTTYTLKGTTNGCAKTVSATITTTALPVITISPTSPTVCLGSAITLTCSGASTYTWNTSATTTTISATPTINTSYSVTGTASTGCKNTAIKTVTVSNQISVVGTTIICAGASTTLTANGSTSYSWSTGATASSIVVSPTTSTTYTVRGTTGSCVKTLSITVTVNTINVGISSSTPSICVGGVAILTASGAATYSWNTGANTASISVSPTINTIYTVTGTSSLGCTKTATILIDASCTFNYNNIGYKTAWTNFAGTQFANDILSISSSNFYGWPNAISKNTLKSNLNGWAELIFTESTNYVMLGFHDSTSVTHQEYLDIDYGFYKELDNIYAIVDGSLYLISNGRAGDTAKMDRTGNVFSIKINSVTQFTAEVSPLKNWKLKVNLNSNDIANIGASFVDSTNIIFPNYVRDIPTIKHSVPGQDIGQINLIPKINGATQTFTWSPGGTNNSSLNNLTSGSYSVNVKDAGQNLTQQKYEVGYKTKWTNLTGTIYRNDSLYVDQNGGYYAWPYAVSKNTLKPNVDGWAQAVISEGTDYLMLGFHDSTSCINTGYTDIDYGFYKELNRFFLIVNGSFYLYSNSEAGDVVKIERLGTEFNLKLNGVIIYNTTVSATRNWKLKLALNSNPISNIGASFIDSTGIDFPNFVSNNVLTNHASGLYINDGGIKLTPKSNQGSNTYLWTPDNETNSSIYNKAYGNYTVAISDNLLNTSTFKYDILYKTKWENLEGCFARQDSLIWNPSSTYGWNIATSKNILKANIDGEISWIIPNTYQYQIIGFYDTSSVISNDYTAFDNALYSAPNPYYTTLYYFSNGTYYNLGTTIPGDVLKIKRSFDTLIYFQNGAPIFNHTVNNSNVDWRVKTAFSYGYNCGEVGASFNTNFNVSIDKEHADYLNPTNGSATVIPYGGFVPYRSVWNDSIISPSRNDLFNKRYTVISYADSTIESAAIGHIVNIGTKPYWQKKLNGNSDLDSVWVYRHDSLGVLIAANMVDKNKSGEFELKVTTTNQDHSFGFFGSTMNVTFYDQFKTDSVLALKTNLGYSLMKAAVSNSLTYTGGKLNLPIEYNEINLIRIHNGEIQLLLKGADITSLFRYRSGDYIKVGRSAIDGKIFVSRNDTLLYKHNVNINDQYFHSIIIAASNSYVSKKGIILPGDDAVILPSPVKLYAVTKRKLDGGYYSTVSNQLLFIAEGEYNQTSLKFNIYNKAHQVVISNGNIGSNINSNIQYLGDNRYVVTLPTLITGYYTLEVINEKNEKKYLRFYHKPLCINCN